MCSLTRTQTSALGFYEQETNLQTEAKQHCKAEKLFKGKWEYKEIGDREQQIIASLGVVQLQRIASLGV